MFPKHFGNVIKNDIEIVLKTLTNHYIYISVYNLVQISLKTFKVSFYKT